MPLLLWLTLLVGPPPAAGAPRWLTDLDEAQRQAKKAGKPIFVVFRCEH